MIKLFISLLFIASLLCARENPFTPPSLKNQILSNIQKPEEKMGVEKLSMPPDAVKLRRVTVEFYRLDGATDRRTFEIDKTLQLGSPLWLKQEEAAISQPGVKSR